MTAVEKLGLILFLGIIAIVYTAEIFLVLAFVFNKLRGGEAVKIFCSKPALAVHLLAIIGIICFAYGYFVEPYWIKIKTVQIQTPKLAKTALRLIQISDLHCDKKPRNEEKLVKLINEMKPDIIVFTGDSINTRAALEHFKETMKNLNAGLAKFAIDGNIDIRYRSGLDLFGGTGFEVLDANTVALQKNGESFYISGLSCKYPQVFGDVLKNVPEDRFSIFLYHYPDLIEDLQNLNVDLYLAGHTHGGQVALPLYGALITLSKFGKKYEAGLYTVGTTMLYVNRGIGTEGGLAPRVRFFARPEITVFDIKPNK
jgi:hypothetical protein